MPASRRTVALPYREIVRITHEAGLMFDSLVRPNISGWDDDLKTLLLVGDVVRGGQMGSAHTFDPANLVVALVNVLEGLVGRAVHFGEETARVDVFVTGSTTRGNPRG